VGEREDEERAMTTQTLIWTLRGRGHEYLQLCKPRVVSLIVFTAMIGMFLATPGLPEAGLFLLASLGIGLAASGAAAFNCLVEQRIDAQMARTRGRPLPLGRVGSVEALMVALGLAALGLFLLYRFVNPLAAWLTFGTFIGYAVVYTVLLKPATPQNIVIGGASGAMPPVLGWAAMTGGVGHEALLLFLIIFAWTPPHFWSLALYRRTEYARAGLPMLPVTHGEYYTRLHILFYTLLLAAVTALPLATGMSGGLYAMMAVGLNAVFLVYAWRLFRNYSDDLARRTFAWSIVYLSLLFAALLLDHWIQSFQ
jgi:protoheme IX farnesyltransferase